MIALAVFCGGPGCQEGPSSRAEGPQGLARHTRLDESSRLVDAPGVRHRTASPAGLPDESGPGDTPRGAASASSGRDSERRDAATPPSDPGPRPTGPSAAVVGGHEPSPATERLVREYLDRLQSRDLRDADAAFRELWEVPQRLIPGLLRHVEDPRSTLMLRLQVIVFGNVAQADPHRDEWVYYVPGMAGVSIDDLASGRAKRPGSFRVVLKRRSTGFSLGTVVRAALLNRFRSPDYPAGDDRHDPAGWWYRYYAKVRDKL